MPPTEQRPIVGRTPEELTLPERAQNAGKWIAIELYAPPAVRETGQGPQVEMRVRRIRAVGDSAQQCMTELQKAGLDPEEFEFTRLTPAY